MSTQLSPARKRAVIGGSIASFILMVALAALVWTGVARALGSPCDTGVECADWESVEAGEAIGEAFQVLDREGLPIATVAGPARVHVPLERLPAPLVEGYVAVEDRRFWNNFGVDPVAMVRAAFGNLSAGEVVSGASTIPMQLVRTIWAAELQEVGRWKRKLHEIWIAPRLVRDLGRSRTLEMYLNSVYLGDGVHGVEAASRHYFGVPAGSLSVGQIATLIGVTRTPGRYHPRTEPERARARRDLVLALMAEEGVIDPHEAEQAAAEPLSVAPRSGLTRSRTYVTAAVMRELRRVAPELTRVGGLRIHTTIDAEIQAAGEAAVQRGLERIEAGERGPPASPESVARLQASGIAIDPYGGGIRGLVGGRDFGSSELDRATQARRPVGSLVKPILLATALEDGAQLHHSISSAPISFAVEGGRWSPDDHVEAGAISLLDMLALSSNRAAVRLGRSVGLERFRAQAEALGLDARVPPFPSAFLGAFDATLLDVVSAYSPFTNGGRSIEPYLIESIRSRSGDVLYEREPETGTQPPAIDEATAFLVREAMRQVVSRGTGWRARQAYSGPAAGKTGTSDGGHDVWFVGFTPELAAGIWVGYDMPAPITEGGSGGSLAAPTWGDWMGSVSPATPRDEWTPPSDVTVASLDEVTGLLLPDACSASVRQGLRQVYVTAGAPRTNSCLPAARIEARARMNVPPSPSGGRDAALGAERLRFDRRMDAPRGVPTEDRRGSTGRPR